MLDTYQLNVFLVAAETLNFSEAARRLYMTQPSVSQHIRSLEDYFNQALFVRSGRHVQLTDAGRALVPLARDVVNRTINLEEQMRSLEGTVYGHLVVGCSTTPGKYIVPILLARFHALYPQVTITCQVASQEKTVEMVCAGEAHFTIATAPNIACRDVEFYQFITDPVVLIAPINHPWAKRKVIEPEELYEAQFIMREEGASTIATVREGLAEIGINYELLQSFMVLSNPEAIALAVQEGVGVGFVSNIILTQLSLNGIKVIPVRGLNLVRDIYIGQHAGRNPTAAQAAFWKFITGGNNLDLQTLNFEREGIFAN